MEEEEEGIEKDEAEVGELRCVENKEHSCEHARQLGVPHVAHSLDR